MAIYAANCPCCGRDIGFDEGVKEYTCIFCGAKLITATLVKERLDKTGGSGYEHYRKDDAKDEPHNANTGRVVRDKQKEEPSVPHGEEHIAPKPEPKKEEPELTEEEVRAQLMRKTEFKQELRDVVKEIDNLRSRREHFTSQLKTCKTLMIIGLVLIALAAAVMVLPSGMIQDNTRLMAAAVLAALGLAILIISESKKNGVKKQQKKLEENISEKKEKRDILIGRLNKINMRLHIHSGEE